MRHATLLAGLFALLAAACRRSAPAPPTPPRQRHDTAPRSAPSADCSLDLVRWTTPEALDGATPVSIEGGALAIGPNGPWLTWLDRTTSTLMIAPPAAAPLRIAIEAADAQAPVVAPVGTDSVLTYLASSRAGRSHRVLRSDGRTVVDLFAQAEQQDDGMSLTIAPTSAGALIAWDEDRPGAGGGVLLQRVDRNLGPSDRPVAPPPARTVSDPAHDATDPVLLPTADGAAVLVYLAAEDVGTAVANQTAADIYARALDPSGVPRGPAVRVTPAPANRFGVVGLARGGVVWLAYRVAGDSDQESRGDGGAIAIVRLGPDLRPTSSAAYVTEADAMPSGAPALLTDGAGVTVFWTERHGENLVSMRRSVSPQGAVSGPARAEPALRGEIPQTGEIVDATAVVHGQTGGLGVARIRCPPLPPGP